MASIVSNKATPTVTLTSSANPALTQNAVTMTVNVSSAASKPTGTVTFYNGATALGSAVALSSGMATIVTSSLPIGSDSLTAVYSGDSSFSGASSNALVESILDFNLTITSGSSSVTSVTVVPGQTATYNLVVGPIAPATTIPFAVTLSVTGLPPGATYTINPLTIPAGSTSTNVALTITTAPATTARTNPQIFGKGMAPLMLGLLLLPFAGKMRRNGKRLGRLLMLLLVWGVGASAFLGLSGCVANSGFFGQPQQTYTISVTGTSGTLIHSTTVTLIVE